MPEVFIGEVKIKHEGDVDQGLRYLREHWNDAYILEIFKDARTSSDRDGVLKINGIEGYYVLRYLGDDTFSLSWRAN